MTCCFSIAIKNAFMQILIENIDTEILYSNEQIWSFTYELKEWIFINSKDLPKVNRFLDSNRNVILKTPWYPKNVKQNKEALTTIIFITAENAKKIKEF